MGLSCALAIVASLEVRKHVEIPPAVTSYITPLDMAPEMSEEVVLPSYELGDPHDSPFWPNQKVFPIKTPNGLELLAIVSTSTDGKELMKAMKELLKKKARPALYGLMRYELCRPLFQPLATFEGKTMKHLMLSDEKINLSALLGTLNLTR